MDDLGISSLPSLIMDQGIKVKSHSVTCLRYEVGSFDPCVDRRSTHLFPGGDLFGIERPGNHSIARRFMGQDILDIDCFCFELKKGIGMSSKIGNELSGTIGQMIQSKRVPQFTSSDTESTVSILLQEVIQLFVQRRRVRMYGDQRIV